MISRITPLLAARLLAARIVIHERALRAANHILRMHGETGVEVDVDRAKLKSRERGFNERTEAVLREVGL